jgi:hypothetical protein
MTSDGMEGEAFMDVAHGAMIPIQDLVILGKLLTAVV